MSPFRTERGLYYLRLLDDDDQTSITIGVDFDAQTFDFKASSTFDIIIHRGPFDGVVVMSDVSPSVVTDVLNFIEYFVRHDSDLRRLVNCCTSRQMDVKKLLEVFVS